MSDGFPKNSADSEPDEPLPQHVPGMTNGQFAWAIIQWERRTGKKYPYPKETDAEALFRRIMIRRKWARELALSGDEFPGEWVSPEEAEELEVIRQRVRDEKG